MWISKYRTSSDQEIKLEKAAQGKPSAKYRPTRLVVDAAFRRIGKSRHGGHKIANRPISVNCQRDLKTDFTHGFSIFFWW